MYKKFRIMIRRWDDRIVKMSYWRLFLVKT